MAVGSSASTVTTGVILAGGLGTRLRPVVADVPKPMAPVAGRPFLEYQLDYWIDQGLREFVLSVGYMHEKVTAHFGHTYRGCPIRYAVEQEPLGTGGGLLLAAQEVNDEQGPLLVLNGDTFFDVPLAALSRFHEASRADWTFALFRTTDSERYMGMDLAADGSVSGLGRPMKGAESIVANGGVYVVQPAALRRTPFRPGEVTSLEKDILPALIESGGRLCGREFEGRFIDIGVPEDYRRAATVLQELRK